MKTIIFTALICICLTFGFKEIKNYLPEGKHAVSNNLKLYCPEVSVLYKGNFENLKSNTDIKNESYSDDWYSKISESIIKDEYNLSFNDKSKCYQSPNRENNLRFIYHKNGFTVIPRDLNGDPGNADKKSEWKIEFSLNSNELNNSSANKNKFYSLVNNDLVVDKNTAYIENENIRINYTNDESGMRQDFIIKNKISKVNNDGQLKLSFTADTKLKMITGSDALMFKDSSGECKMKYSALKVFDANGRELRAYFENNDKLQITNDKLEIEKKNDQLQITNYKLQIGKREFQFRNPKFQIKTNSKSFAIVVNDEDAVYPITIDPLSSSPSWTAESNSDKAAMGASVCSAGDVNGDGYGDVIIGAPEFDNGIYRQGKVYVYHGSAAGLSASPNWSFLGNQIQCFLGTSVSTAGDVNGDGYSDVIIGAPDYTNGQTREGKVFVFYGSSSGLNASPNWTAESNASDSKFGISVSTCGDVNGDGYSDVIIGSSTYDNGPNGKGKAFVYFGSPSGLSLNANWSAVSHQDNSGFGNCVSTAGDVNGDGYSDIIIASYLYDNGQIDEGRVFAYYGSSTGPDTAFNWSAESNQTAAEFGISISTAGDVNGDGYSDVIIGAEKFDVPAIDAGKIFVYNGSASGLSALPNWTYSETQASANLGYSVSLAGDVNGDGYSDIIASAISYDNGETNEGKVYLFYGGSTGINVTPDWSAEGNQSEANFGSSVFTAGDVNGDGISDIIIGAKKFDNGQTDEGKVFVYTGSASGLAQTHDWTYGDIVNDSKLGTSVSNAGDVNGDGYSDIIFSAPDYNTNHTGFVFGFYGSANGFSLGPNWITSNYVPYSEYGTSVSTAGDVNGDGYSDVLVGAYNDTTVLNGHTGKVYLYLGSASGLSATPDWVANGGQDSCYFGYSVSTAGDINGDGYSDVIIGAMKYDDTYTDEGKIFVYYGSASGLPSTAGFTFHPNIANKYFGRSVSSAGDFNGDGFGDVVIGGSKYVTNGSDNNGSFYAMQGTINGLLNGYVLNVNGVNEDATLGWSVSCAGDINGDGYSDIIIGTPKYSNGQTEEGKITIYKGSQFGFVNSVPVNIESNVAMANFGQSVSSAGDVNGDGYSDVATGAWNYYNGTFYVGAAYVYYGSASGVSAANYWSNVSTTVFSQFGYCVSSAGDVNGDGYSDIIVGSPNNHFRGSVFVYFGNEKKCIKSNIQQYKPNSNNVVSAGGFTGTSGGVKLSLFGKSFSGRADCKMVYEYKGNGQPFSSGLNISNSVSSSGSGNITDVGISGLNFTKDISGLNPAYEYKWRTRLQYNQINNPYQKYGPWKYYNNYSTNPAGGFKPVYTIKKTITITALIQGLYNPNTQTTVSDTISVYLRQQSPPYSIVDSSKGISSQYGLTVLSFYNTLINNVYVQMKHRNSIETWSSGYVTFYSGNAGYYNFVYPQSAAYGNNEIKVSDIPEKYALYSGDVNQDGIVDLSDNELIDNDANNFLSGYVRTDLTGDNFVDLADLTIADNNAFNFVSVIRP
jgi:FG-GAP repeat